MTQSDNRPSQQMPAQGSPAEREAHGRKLKWKLKDRNVQLKIMRTSENLGRVKPALPRNIFPPNGLRIGPMLTL